MKQLVRLEKSQNISKADGVEVEIPIGNYEYVKTDPDGFVHIKTDYGVFGFWDNQFKREPNNGSLMFEFQSSFL